jgi:hypothetical protein
MCDDSLTDSAQDIAGRGGTRFAAAHKNTSNAGPGQALADLSGRSRTREPSIVLEPERRAPRTQIAMSAQMNDMRSKRGEEVAKLIVSPEEGGLHDDCRVDSLDANWAKSTLRGAVLVGIEPTIAPNSATAISLPAIPLNPIC